MPSKGDVIANRYKLVRPLGEGAMGTVWLAQHLTLEVPCAVKFILGESMNDPSYRARFHLEARTVAQLKGPNIVRVLDHALDDENPAYIAMEYLEGEDLWTHLQRLGRIDGTTTHAIVAQVARGLTRAHAAGIVHRDLKPENIFLANEDGEIVVKILDFGVAKWTVRSPFDEVEGLVGTPEYMSPEQLRAGRDADYRADLWALAVVAYQCLTGHLPFQAPTLTELIGLVLNGARPIPSQVAPDLASRFDGFWARATASEAADRFQSGAELAAALADALGVTPVVVQARTDSQPATVRIGPAGLSRASADRATPVATTASAVPLHRRRRNRRAALPRAAAVAAAILAIAASAHSDSVFSSRRHVAANAAGVVAAEPNPVRSEPARTEAGAALAPLATGPAPEGLTPRAAPKAEPEARRVAPPSAPIVSRAPRVVGANFASPVHRAEGRPVPVTLEPSLPVESAPVAPVPREAPPKSEEPAVDFGI